MDLMKLILGIFTGGAGSSIGGTVSIGAQIAAVLAAVTPITLALIHNKDQVFIAITYGQLAFWGSMLAVNVLLVVRLVHRAAPPA